MGDAWKRRGVLGDAGCLLTALIPAFLWTGMGGKGSDGVYYNIYDELDTSPVEWHITEVKTVPLALTLRPLSQSWTQKVLVNIERC